MDRSSILLRLFLVAPLLAGALALSSQSPVSAAYTCSQNQTVTGTIRESLIVPANTDCGLSNVVIRGGVTIEAGASLSGGFATVIRGSVTGSGIDAFQLVGGSGRAEIRGNVTITGSRFVFLMETDIRGDVALSGANVYSRLQLSTVGDSATFTGNAQVYVDNNTIESDLICSSNGTVSAFSNTVGGTNQC